MQKNLPELAAKTALLSLCSVVISTIVTVPAQASGLRFNTQVSPNEYQYQVFASFPNEPSIAGESFTLSGLSGVTGATVLSTDLGSYLAGLLDVSFTPTSATWTWKNDFADSNGVVGYFDPGDVNGVSLSTFDFRVFSTSPILGEISSVGTNGFSERTQGAVAVPSPALLPGLIGLGVGVLRKRRAKAAEQAVES